LIELHHQRPTPNSFRQLGGCGLPAFPSEVGQMTGLRRLNAAMNRLRDLPASFEGLTELRVAFFLGCEFEVVPEVLGRLPKLFMLSFKANRLSCVPERSLATSLSWLILSDNRLASLPESLGSLRGLRKLMLAGNALARLPASLGKCTQLELVRLSDNRLAELPLSLLSLPRLAWIALAANDFNRRAGEAGWGVGGGPALPPLLPAGSVTLVQGVPPLGRGASGVVFRGVLTSGASASSSGSYSLSSSSSSSASFSSSSSASLAVAVKLFAAAKTSDGDPADEMAATAVAGATGCPHLVASFGRLSPDDARAMALEACSNGGSNGGGGWGGGMGTGGLGLVLELLRGYSALAAPPSFDSVTRDVYPGDGPALAAAPFPGEAVAPGKKFRLATAVGILASVAAAAAALHARGLTHGDLYAHNILLRPLSSEPLPAEQPASGQHPVEAGDGWAVLSDLGAAFFYRSPGQPPPLTGGGGAGGGGSDACWLLERVEVLAFGHLVSELLARCAPRAGASDEAAGAADSAAAVALVTLAEDCRGAEVGARPSFAEVLRRVQAAAAIL